MCEVKHRLWKNTLRKDRKGLVKALFPSQPNLHSDLALQSVQEKASMLLMYSLLCSCLKTASRTGLFWLMVLALDGQDRRTLQSIRRRVRDHRGWQARLGIVIPKGFDLLHFKKKKTSFKNDQFYYLTVSYMHIIHSAVLSLHSVLISLPSVPPCPSPVSFRIHDFWFCFVTYLV